MVDIESSMYIELELQSRSETYILGGIDINIIAENEMRTGQREVA